VDIGGRGRAARAEREEVEQFRVAQLRRADVAQRARDRLDAAGRFLFPGIETTLQQDDWYLMRTMLQNGGDLERYLADHAEPGALTAALNWYRANVAPERLNAPPAQLPPIQAPTMGVFSTGDLYLTEDAMVRSAEFVKGPWRYERIEGISHWIPSEAPEQFNQLMLDFLRE